MRTVIYSHPNPDSSNGAVFNAARQKLASTNQKSTLVDLYGENFTPVLTSEKHAGIGKEAPKGAQVKRYQDILMSKERLVLFLLLWWNAPPTMIKGFFDRVCLQEFVFTQTSREILGKLRHIKSVLVLTTSNTPTFALKLFMGNTIKRHFIGSVLKGIGIRDCQWLNCGGMPTATAKPDRIFCIGPWKCCNLRSMLCCS